MSKKRILALAASVAVFHKTPRSLGLLAPVRHATRQQSSRSSGALTKPYYCYYQSKAPRRRTREALGVLLQSKSPTESSARPDQNAKGETLKSRKPAGVYVRPSAAIERGSGFFVPGLEGPRVRWVVGGVLLLASMLNAVLVPEAAAGSSPPPPTVRVAQIIAVAFSLLVLLQGGVESFRSSARPSPLSPGSSASSATTSSSSASSWPTFSVLDDDADLEDRVSWAAATYLSLTRATLVLLIRDDQVVFGLHKPPPGPPASVDWSYARNPSKAAAWKAAGATVRAVAAESGRAALPPNHPTAVAARDLFPEAAEMRTVLLQRVLATSTPSMSSYCFVVASPDLLAAFSPRDLKALGQLADYCRDGEPESPRIS